MLKKCFGESNLLRTRIFVWHKTFSARREFIENLPRASRPSTSVSSDNIKKVKERVSPCYHHRDSRETQYLS